MPASRILKDLEAIAAGDDFAFLSSGVVDGWEATGVGAEAVEPVFRFMESHPDVEYGMPGALVHFVENVTRNLEREYEALLLESLERRPTSHTTWMLNRVLNATEDPVLRRQLIQALEQVTAHPLADEVLRAEARHFLEGHACR